MSGQSIERLMEIVLQMRINLTHVTETLYQQTFEIREQLGAVFDEEKQSLEGCLKALDQKLEECSVCIADYRDYTSSSRTYIAGLCSWARSRTGCRPRCRRRALKRSLPGDWEN